MVVAEETGDGRDDEYSIYSFGGDWDSHFNSFEDPEHPLSTGHNLRTDPKSAVYDPTAKQRRSKYLSKHFKEVLKRHGKTLKEVAAAWGIDCRTLNKYMGHPETLDADTAWWLCEFIGCELNELRYPSINENRETVDWYMSLNDYHKEVVRNVIWSLKQAEKNVNSLLRDINEMEDETGDVSRFIKRRNERICRQIDEDTAEWNAERTESSDEK